MEIKALVADSSAKARKNIIRSLKEIGVRKVTEAADGDEAIQLLQFSPRRAAVMYLKVLKSAVANASQDENVDVNQLYVSDARADDGPLQQHRLRWRPGPQGRAMPVRKRTSHLTVVVAERAE